MKKNTSIAIGIIASALTACGSPEGLTDEQYAVYKQLGAPKILFSCVRLGETTPSVGYRYGNNPFASFNSILDAAKADCEGGNIKIIDKLQ